MIAERPFPRPEPIAPTPAAVTTTDKAIFPIAARWERRMTNGTPDGSFPVAILLVDGDVALCLKPWGHLGWIELFELTILEPIGHPIIQAKLRAHVAMAQP